MLSVKQAAARLGVSASLVYELVASGTLPCYRLGKRHRRGTIRFAEADLQAFLARCRVAPEASADEPTLPATRPGAGEVLRRQDRFVFLPPQPS
jgi:excisionase family DNA binding protein